MIEKKEATCFLLGTRKPRASYKTEHTMLNPEKYIDQLSICGRRPDPDPPTVPFVVFLPLIDPHYTVDFWIRRVEGAAMKALGWWLMLVGSLRLASVWFGFFDIWALRLAVFSNTTMTEVHGRTFGVWTLLTCTLCFLCAFNLDNKPLYLATFLSFIYAFGHFLSEFMVYHTMAMGNLITVGIFAGTSIIWMLLQRNAHGRTHPKHS